MTFKEQLKAGRVQYGLLAKRLGVSNNTITRMVEDPERYVRIGDALKIREAFFPGYSLDELFAGDQPISEAVRPEFTVALRGRCKAFLKGTLQGREISERELDAFALVIGNILLLLKEE